MENRTKRPVTYMLIFAIFLAIAFHLDKMPDFFSYLIGITFPLLIGAVLAFVLNVPMRGFENIIKKISKYDKNCSCVFENFNASLYLAYFLISFALFT